MTNRKIYEEKISEELLSRIKSFLNKHKEKNLNYDDCMEGYKLASEAIKEIKDNSEEYYEEYDEIMKDYKILFNGSFKETKEMENIVNNLNNLFSRTRINTELRTMISELFSKRYW